MRISDWSSDVCSSDLLLGLERAVVDRLRLGDLPERPIPDLLGRGDPHPDEREVRDPVVALGAEFNHLVPPSGLADSIMLDRITGRPCRAPPRAPALADRKSGVWEKRMSVRVHF